MPLLHLAKYSGTKQTLSLVFNRKSASEFGHHAARPDRLQAQCRARKRVMQRNWYYRNNCGDSGD
jgi:hypothetical protein